MDNNKDQCKVNLNLKEVKEVKPNLPAKEISLHSNNNQVCENLSKEKRDECVMFLFVFSSSNESKKKNQKFFFLGYYGAQRFPPPPQSGTYPPQQSGGYPTQQPGGQPGGYPPQQSGNYPPRGKYKTHKHNHMLSENF